MRFGRFRLSFHVEAVKCSIHTTVTDISRPKEPPSSRRCDIFYKRQWWGKGTKTRQKTPRCRFGFQDSRQPILKGQVQRFIMFWESVLTCGVRASSRDTTFQSCVRIFGRATSCVLSCWVRFHVLVPAAGVSPFTLSRCPD